MKNTHFKNIFLFPLLLIAIQLNAQTYVDVPLNKMYQYFNAGRPDHMTVHVDIDIPGYVNQGVSWYIPTNPIGAFTVPIHRLFLNGDHMDSPEPNEGGYSDDGILGNPVIVGDIGIGLHPIFRFRSTIGNIDHMTARFAETPADYESDGPFGNGWITATKAPWVETPNTIQDVTSSGITVGVSLGWGGSVTRIMKSGVEYINRYDAGRELQTAFHTVTGDDWENPTEGGDQWSNGSPIVNYDVPVQNQPNRIRTQVNALRWGEHDVTNPTLENPVLSGTLIGKDAIIENTSRINYRSWYRFGKNYNTSYQIEESLTSLLNNIFDTAKIQTWNGSRWEVNRIGNARINDPNAVLWTVPIQQQGQPVRPVAVLARTARTRKYSPRGDRAFAIFMAANQLRPGCTVFSYRRFDTHTGQSLPIHFATLKLGITHDRTGQLLAANSVSEYWHYVVVGTWQEVSAELTALARR
jgi:hypothetical protein